jgi:hypothetical protein
MKGKRPTYIANTVIDGEGKQARWREIGVAFGSEKGGTITVLLDALPVSGKIVLMPPKERPAEEPAA